MTQPIKKIITWSAYQQLLWTAFGRIPRDVREQCKVITGVPRGGLVAAVMLSHATGLPFVQLDENIGKHGKASVLLVDDILDTGETIKRVLRDCGSHMAAVLTPLARARFSAGVLDGCDRLVPCFAGERYPDDENTWWVFPYELEEAKTTKDGTYENHAGSVQR